MLHQNSVFHSLLKHVPWSELEQIVEKYGSDELAPPIERSDEPAGDCDRFGKPRDTALPLGCCSGEAFDDVGCPQPTTVARICGTGDDDVDARDK
jgi:hypothetical protein